MDFSNLQSRVSTAYIPPHRTQLHPRIIHSFSSSPPYSNNKQPVQHKWLILLASLFTLPFLFYLFTTAHKIHHSSKFQDSKPKSFGIVIHSAPTGSRIRIFQFLNEGRIPFIGLDGSGSDSLKVRPGLAGFKDEPKSAGSSILGLIEFAKRRVPMSEWGNTKVQLMASGGLEKLGEDLRDMILESCRQVLRASGFLFKDEWARVIEGQEEGVYSWVAVNYALGTLGGERQETTGIVELGGDSMQVAFAPIEPPPKQFLRTIKLAGVTYNLYTQSMPQFGQDAAWEALYELQNSRNLTSFSSSSEEIPSNPCIPRGYEVTSNESDSKPSGNFSTCKREALKLINKNRGILQPLPPENFFFTSEIFGLVPKASLSELEAAGRQYCEDDWFKLKNQYGSIDDMDLLRYCFSSAYVIAFLHDILGIPMDDNRIGFAHQPGSGSQSVPLDWTLGAFVLQTMMEPLEKEGDDKMGEIVGNESVTYFSLFAFLLIAVLAAFFILRWQKPQLKTIYDLEKGRYIVTRLPR